MRSEFRVIVMLEYRFSSPFPVTFQHCSLQNLTITLWILISVIEKWFSDTWSTHSTPPHDTSTAVLHGTSKYCATYFIRMTYSSPYSLNLILPEQVHFRFITPMVLTLKWPFISLWVLVKSKQPVFCLALWRAFLIGTRPRRPHSFIKFDELFGRIQSTQ